MKKGKRKIRVEFKPEFRIMRYIIYKEGNTSTCFGSNLLAFPFSKWFEVIFRAYDY